MKKITQYVSLIFVMMLTMPMSSYAQDSQKIVPAVPDNNNQKVIKRYNRYRHKHGDYAAARPGYTAVFGVMKNSVMSTEDVEVNIVKEWVQDAFYSDMMDRMYFVEIKNKTDQTIYIDKSLCFRIYHNGDRYCYFDPKRDNPDLSQRMIAIPPHSQRNLSEYKVEKVKEGNSSYLKIIDYPEEFKWDSKSAGITEGFIQESEVRSFTEDQSPYHRSFVIAYSKAEDFSTYSLLTINCYMRQLIGNYYPELYSGVFDEFKRFGADKYTITNCEYGYGGVGQPRKIVSVGE